MSRLFGIVKVVLVLVVDFVAIYSLFKDIYIASTAVGGIALYVMFGGYLDIQKVGAVNSRKLPSYQKNRLEAAKAQLVADVKAASGADISRLKVYLVPGEDDLNATAYGFKCVSVTRGTFDNTDPITLNSVLAHEISHIQHYDPEMNRAVFCSVTLLMGGVSVMSFATIAIIFLSFLVLSCFRSWFGIMAFQGVTKVVRGTFSVMQLGIVMTYRTLISLVSCHAEYRSDEFACKLGYAVQLAHFLAMAQPANQHQMTLREVLYRTHPPTPKRIARLERMLRTRNTTEIAKR